MTGVLLRLSPLQLLPLLLSLCFQRLGRRTPPPTAAELASAYRREAMRWHPDHNQLKPAAEVDDCEARFKQLNEAYGRLRRAAVAGGARSGGRGRGAG